MHIPLKKATSHRLLRDRIMLRPTERAQINPDGLVKSRGSKITARKADLQPLRSSDCKRALGGASVSPSGGAIGNPGQSTVANQNSRINLILINNFIKKGPIA